MTTTTLSPTTGTNSELDERFVRDVLPLTDVLARGARRLAGHHADAEDLLQDTLLRAYAGFATFRDGTNIQAWLFRIMHNQWVNHHRRSRCRPTEVAEDQVSERDVARLASARSAETAALAGLPDDDMRRALASLPDGFAEAVLLVFVEGNTYAETAQLLGLPIGTVMSRVHRGRQRLRIALADRRPRNTGSAASAPNVALGA